MSLPAAFLDELKRRTDLRALVGRTVKLVRAGRDAKGCCPFHQEKTPSFHVFEDHYHCFGCGAHGSAIDWLIQTQGLD
ncbi:MAG: CHC2 zinc finger domain-containing protein, partial [Sphingomonadaceae bacterium]